MFSMFLLAAAIENEIFGLKWYFYFAFLGAVIVVSLIILALWKKQTNTYLAYKYTKKSKAQLLKAKENKNYKVKIMVAQNYMESADFYIAQDDRTEDVSLTFDRRELISEILTLVKKLNQEVKQGKSINFLFIDQIVDKMDSLENIK